MRQQKLRKLIEQVHAYSTSLSYSKHGIVNCSIHRIPPQIVKMFCLVIVELMSHIARLAILPMLSIRDKAKLSICNQINSLFIISIDYQAYQHGACTAIAVIHCSYTWFYFSINMLI